MAFTEDVNKELKEEIRNKFEQNTGIIGQTMRARRKQAERYAETTKEVERVEQLTQKFVSTDDVLKRMEVSFIQISKNVQLIAKAMDAQVTLQEETHAAIERPQLEIGNKRKISSTQAQAISSLVDDKDERSLLGKLSDMVGKFKKTPTLSPKAAAKQAGKEAAKKAVAKGATKEAAKQAGKEAAKKASKAAIKAVAKKSLLKSLGKFAAKSIPFLGLGMGAAFAAERLVKGDIVGAGLEVVGGLGGPLTSVPATIAQTVRDVYFDTYGIYPESDPLRDERLQEVKDAVGEAAEEVMGSKVTPAEPTAKPQPAATSTTPQPTTTAPTPTGTEPTVSAPGQPPVPPPQPVAPPTPIQKPTTTGAPPSTGGGESAMEAALKQEGFDPVAIAAIMAQTSHESGHFKTLQENLNYGASGLMGIFSRYFNSQTAQMYERQPERIANRVYANRMGNGPEESGDGYRYRGRGFIQLTGKVNYAAAGRALGLDLVNNPDLAAEATNASKIAIWYFKKNMGRITNWADTAQITQIVNGGLNGLADRQREFQKYLAKYQGGGTMVAGGPATGREVAMNSTDVAAAKKNIQSGGNVSIVNVNNTTQITTAANGPPRKETMSVVG
jgi:putative chitinase